jgi:hypothetical protein
MRQTAWDRAEYVYRAHLAGVTFKSLAQKLGIGRHRAWQIFHKERGHTSPVEKYLAGPAVFEILEFHSASRASKRRRKAEQQARQQARANEPRKMMSREEFLRVLEGRMTDDLEKCAAPRASVYD